ncbi:nicotinate-nucleotide-dimethylbenzimidazole phosphoribosyltransferase [Limimonas halophila]|uniref:Nicotinate-nucleotide--dimethylbenzimidazole phosphoribosyltransferase n=1 Tax=Limimonas halophila TaxID=1082479 RepID=A0A1G7R7Q6_9PROT|nr:nicotinate-nucleotide--dimethylbenzimidazole phosphoribosyltransferase [Limimonas halophila]SDG06763.1 nicotinate-nucleotide-dimethylbenzimidazole phosphoribosyltransferase [Limimonas halophila]
MAASDAADFSEIRRLAHELPAADEDARARAAEQQRGLAKPPGSLGRLEALAGWLAAWQGKHPPTATRPHIALFAGNHGVAAQGVSAYPQSATQAMVRTFIDGGGAINRICGLMDVDLRVYEMALDEPTRDFTREPAMTEDEAARAMAYGMMAVDGEMDLMALGEMGIANTTAAAALSAAVFGGPARDWVGPGSGLDEAGVAHKAEVVATALRLHADGFTDGLEILRRVGGLELAAVAGAVLACRLARVPVVLDGYAATAAAATLTTLAPGMLDHCVVAHVSAEPGHRRLLDALGMRALQDLDMRLGEATGAALAIPLIQSACACHTGMTTLDAAGVTPLS